MLHLAPHSHSDTDDDDQLVLLRSLIAEIQLLRRGIWWGSIVPVSLGLLFATVYLTIQGMLSMPYAVMLLTLVAVAHYAPDATGAIVEAITTLVNKVR